MFNHLVQLLFASSIMLQVTHAGVYIIDGNKVNVKNYPYVVSIESLPYADKLPEKVFMGNGALITPNKVLTAADCGNFCLPVGCEIRAGHTDIFSGGQVIKARDIIAPDKANCTNYLNDCMQYDISLVTLEHSFVLTIRVQPIPLAYPTDKLPVGTCLSIAGWGPRQPLGILNVSHKLIAGTTHVRPFSECWKANQHHIHSRRNLCVGVEICPGDAGSAAVFDGRLVGIATYITGCTGMLQNTSVLVDVTGHLDWIQSHIDQ